MTRLYCALLCLYPLSFRNEYGAEMRAIFARRLRDASSPFARLSLWVEVVGDVLVNAVAAHWDILRQDLRYSVRALARTPSFTLTAIMVVALGVGANTAVFSVTDFVLIRPLPFREPDRLFKLWESPGECCNEVSPANYRDWKRMNTSFGAMGAFVPMSANLVGMGEPQRVLGTRVTPDLFPLLGAQPYAGRLFTEQEQSDGASTMLISYGLWQSQFGGQEVIGKRLLLDGAPYVVIGIMPPAFHYPDRDASLWTPMRFQERDFAERDDNYLTVIGRLRDRVSVEQATADMGAIAIKLQQQYPREDAKVGVALFHLNDELTARGRLLLLTLCGAALCILLLACANLANLLLVRAVARERELAVRTALGAGRERLVRQMITESVVLAAIGGGIGVILAVGTVPFLATLVPPTLPLSSAPMVDLRVLLFAGTLTAATGLAFGLIPAMRTGGKAGLSGLRDGARSGGGRKERVRSALVMIEVMASVVLLISSGLLVRAMWRLQAMDPGFRAENVLTLRTALPWPKYRTVDARERFYNHVLTGVRALPTVTHAAYIAYLPMAMRGGIWPVAVNGEPVVRAPGRFASLRYATPGFFATMGIPVARGRDVEDSDARDKPWVAVVSESFARRYWPGSDPLGKHFDFAFHDRTVVGVAGDIRVRGFEQQSEPQVYLPSAQVADGAIPFYTPKELVVRSSAPEASLLPGIRRLVREADSDQPISNVRMMSEIVSDQTASRAAQARVLIVLAGLAFLIAGLGLHGLLSFSVSQRAREIGLRMALGARRGDIVTMVVRRGAVLALAGILPGAALAYAAGRAMQSLLAGITPTDTPTFAAAIGLCVAMATIGCLLPALRASRVDPLSVMRSE